VYISLSLKPPKVYIQDGAKWKLIIMAAPTTTGKVSIVLGSKSDVPVITDLIKTLQLVRVGYEVRILSAHRNPEALRTYVTNCDADVYVAVAGMSAALPGVIASMKRNKVVIGLPVSGKDPETAMRSMVQMPPGVPVATIGLDNGKNAAILAVQVIANKYPDVEKSLMEMIRVESEKTLSGAVEEEAKLNPPPVETKPGGWSVTTDVSVEHSRDRPGGRGYHNVG
jgi:5-(carboxyamino)imidazole ribonucleotide mutase